MEKLSRGFYERDTLIVARELLGKLLVHHVNGEQLQCIISDVEAYTGVNDRACHAFGGRLTPRTEPLWGIPGHAYVYLIYGMYDMLNIVTEKEGNPCAVLIRGVIPKQPLDTLSIIRYQKTYKELTKAQIKNFSNGPGKVCKTLQIDLSHNKLDLLGDVLTIYDAPNVSDGDVQIGKRINIDYAEEAKDYMYRFYIE
ncbi:MAG: DNA-3-methyladenine glycosylase [Vallitaleaceae bacterium]|nr:DNA-3-methyladenine glycosylase [Vallitaleaceae bacterium]